MSDVPWFVEAFGRHYLTVYAHRDDESAAREAGFAVRALGLRSGETVLDLACGAGRHARALAARGLRVIGVDLSRELLTEAVSIGSGAVEYLRADMRRLPFQEAFDAACQFFTSFGYFETEEEDRRALSQAAGVLIPGGRILIDYVNRDQVLATLVPESRDRAGDLVIEQSRRITPDGRRVEKRVRISEGGTPPREYTESVRLYSPEEVTEMFEVAGLETTSRYGDLEGGSFGADSARLVLVGRRACS